ncbi:MAG: DUF721 domain-containing protein [Spirochaetales bacterium]|nr:DUF721 domain-containing protein [Spirochaetales bacterium]
MKRASDVLSKLLDENSRGKAQSYSSVFGGWRDLAGLSLAEHSRVYEIKHQNLFVEVDHNGWMQILFLRKTRILNKLRSRYPELEIQDLKVRINPGMSRSGSQESGSRPDERTRDDRAQAGGAPAATPADSPGGSSQVDRVVSGVKQESLRSQLRRLFLSSLKDERKPRRSGGTQRKESESSQG